MESETEVKVRGTGNTIDYSMDFGRGMTNKKEMKRLSLNDTP